jgi:hypothetical protein
MKLGRWGAKNGKISQFVPDGSLQVNQRVVCRLRFSRPILTGCEKTPV